MPPTVSDVLQLANLIVGEDDLTSTCERCGVPRRLSDCRSRAVGLLRSYDCSACGHLLVEVVRRTGNLLGSGCYQAGDWVLRPTVDLFAYINGNPIRVGVRGTGKPSKPRTRWEITSV